VQILAVPEAAAGVFAGYFGGGEASSGLVSGIDKITFADDSKSTLAATLTTARSFLAGMADSGTL
jgi:hypothetical protein